MSKKITYRFEHMPDQSVEGIKNEVTHGLAVIAFDFATRLGFPYELFEEMIKEKMPTLALQVAFYMDYRNEHPKLPWS